MVAFEYPAEPLTREMAKAQGIPWHECCYYCNGDSRGYYVCAECHLMPRPVGDAEATAKRLGVPLVTVQDHYARDVLRIEEQNATSIRKSRPCSCTQCGHPVSHNKVTCMSCHPMFHLEVAELFSCEMCKLLLLRHKSRHAAGYRIRCTRCCHVQKN